MMKLMIFAEDLKPEDVREILQAMRNVEQRDTTRHFEILADLRPMSFTQIAKAYSVNPPFPVMPYTFTERWDERRGESKGEAQDAVTP